MLAHKHKYTKEAQEVRTCLQAAWPQVIAQLFARRGTPPPPPTPAPQASFAPSIPDSPDSAAQCPALHPQRAANCPFSFHPPTESSRLAKGSAGFAVKLRMYTVNNMVGSFTLVPQFLNSKIKLSGIRLISMTYMVSVTDILGSCITPAKTLNPKPYTLNP